MPCHSLEFLPKSLQSISNQSLDKEKFELLLIADRINVIETKKILDTAEIRYRILESKIPGIVPALNLGLNNIKSEYVARMDEDDIMLPNRLELQLKYMDENKETLAVGGQLLLIDRDDAPIGKSTYRKKIANSISNLLTNSPIAHPASMFRLQSVISIGGYRDFLPEDWDLWIRLREIGPIGNLDCPVLKYRVHAKQLSRQTFYSQKIAKQYVSVSYFARKSNLMDHPNITEGREEWMENTKKILTSINAEYRKFEVRSNRAEELYNVLYLTPKDLLIWKFFLFGLRHPLLVSNFLISKFSSKIKKVYL
jgi:glycosyltransferase involved in cell wall biosynthesis